MKFAGWILLSGVLLSFQTVLANDRINHPTNDQRLSSSECEFFLLQSTAAPEQPKPSPPTVALEPITLELLQKNVMIAPELTITNEVLHTIRTPFWFTSNQTRLQVGPEQFDRLPQLLRKHIASFSPEQSEAIVRAVLKIFNPLHLEIFVNYPGGTYDIFSAAGKAYTSHRQPLTFRMTLENGEKMGATVEDGVVEFNRAPVHLDELATTWKSVFPRIKAQGFRGSLGRIGDGGGHLWLGYDDQGRSENNLFLQNPALMGQILDLPLRNPFLSFFLNEFGGEETSQTPFTVVGFNRSHYWVCIDHLLKATPLPANPIDIHDYWSKAFPECSVLLNHDQYISLKRFTQLGAFEIRLQRSFDSFEDLEASANLWIRGIAYEAQHPIQNLSRWTSLYDRSAFELRDDFHRWANQIGLSRADREQVTHFGGWRNGEVNGIRQSDANPWNQRIQSALRWPEPNVESLIDLRIETPPGFPVPTSFLVNGSKVQGRALDKKTWVLTVPAAEWQSRRFLISPLDARDQVLNTSILDLHPRADGFFDAQLFSALDTKNFDASWLAKILDPRVLCGESPYSPSNASQLRTQLQSLKLSQTDISRLLESLEERQLYRTLRFGLRERSWLSYNEDGPLHFELRNQKYPIKAIFDGPQFPVAVVEDIDLPVAVENAFQAIPGRSDMAILSADDGLQLTKTYLVVCPSPLRRSSVNLH